VLGLPPTAWDTRPAQAAIYLQMADILETLGWEGLEDLISATSLTLPPVMAERELTPRFELRPETAPTVLRGAARSDLPTPEEIATLQMPVLLLPWAGDPGHPLSTAERLHELLPDSQLFVAEHAADADTWPDRIAGFLG
jgi:pimeloyl-ACP methyl ester carboxylesterase